jgi:hypothetical protein
MAPYSTTTTGKVPKSGHRPLPTEEYALINTVSSPGHNGSASKRKAISREKRTRGIKKHDDGIQKGSFGSRTPDVQR